MVSQITGLVTKDGRKRAPKILVGVQHKRPFPAVRIAIALGIAWYLYDTNYRKPLRETPQQKFLRKIQVRPYGVLGTQLTLQGSLHRVAPEPDENTVIVDPAGLKYIHSLASLAGGAAGAIYHWLRLTGAFPQDVQQYVTKVCDAKLHEYDDGAKKVIHCVGPDFRVGEWSEREAAIELSRAYRNVLHEFAVSDGHTLRMLPISGGVFAGPLYNQLPPITQQALAMAFEQLHQFDREYILRENKNVELCIFMDREWDHFKKVFDNVTPSMKM